MTLEAQPQNTATTLSRAVIPAPKESEERCVVHCATHNIDIPLSCDIPSLECCPECGGERGVGPGRCNFTYQVKPVCIVKKY